MSLMSGRGATHWNVCGRGEVRRVCTWFFKERADSSVVEAALFIAERCAASVVGEREHARFVGGQEVDQVVERAVEETLSAVGSVYSCLEHES